MERKEIIKIIVDDVINEALVNDAIFRIPYDLKDFFEEYCIHKDEYSKEYPWETHWYWAECRDCPLRNIDWEVPRSSVMRDVCFAIWHEREQRTERLRSR